MQRNTKKTLKPKIYATKSKNCKQIPKTLKNLQHLCCLERYLNNLLCNKSNHYNIRKRHLLQRDVN